MAKHSHPPKWLDRFLEWYCKPEFFEDLQGDLYEYYEDNLEKGRWLANLIYFIDVVKFMRIYTTRKPKILDQMTFIHLFNNYLKTSARNIVRNRLFTTINIFGLSIAMSIGLLVISYLSELKSFDQFHVNKEEIYRITPVYQNKGEDPVPFASSSVFIWEKLKNEFDGLENLLLLRRGFNEDIQKGDNKIAISGYYSTPEFFDLFSFQVIYGDVKSMLVEPNSIVLTESSAKKLFKDTYAVGEVVSAENKEYVVTGIIADLPLNTHFSFEALASFSTVENQMRSANDKNFFTWRSIWNNYVYFQIPEGGSTRHIEQYLGQVAAEQNAQHERYDICFELQKLTEIVPGRDLSNQIGMAVGYNMVWPLAGLAFVILLCACFNYTNLSIARSLRRSKEVGMRKIVGARRVDVFTQFITEAVLISLVALVFALLISQLIKPAFLEIVSEDGQVQLNMRIRDVFYFILFAIGSGILAGVLPSSLLSKFKALSVLRDLTNVKLFRGLNLRRVLIVLQLTISIGFIIGSVVAYRQYVFALTYDLGFSTENVINVPLQGNDAQILETELSKVSGVESISKSTVVMGSGNKWVDRVRYQDPEDKAEAFVNYVTTNFLELHDFRLLAGNGFPYDLKKNEKAKYAIVDSYFLERFHIPLETAIGEQIEVLRSSDTSRLEICGVVNEFQYARIEDDQRPIIFHQGQPSDFRYLNVKAKTSDVFSLVEQMEKGWRSVDEVHPFEAEFYDDYIKKTYEGFVFLARLFGFLAVLAISIASLGLLGMAVFSTETRIKEISVRKVLGASEQNLVYILSKGFVALLVVSSLIAVPLSYFIFNEMLNDSAKRVSIGVFDLASGVVVILVIGLSTIVSQTLSAAKTNPADLLRSE